jgi:hypothetical protein
MVSQQQAREIAAAYLTRKDVPADWKGIGKVVTLCELERCHMATPSLWFLAAVDLSNCWIAYVERAGPPVIRSSDVILVDQATGEVPYAGSASDEG